MWKVASCSGIVNKPMWNMQKKKTVDKIQMRRRVIYWKSPPIHCIKRRCWYICTNRTWLVSQIGGKFILTHFCWVVFLCWFGVIIMLDGIFVSFTLYLIKLQRCGKFSFTLQIIFSHFGSYDGICKSRTPNMVFMEFPFDFRSELNIYTCV